jgi:hypothetical protein
MWSVRKTGRDLSNRATDVFSGKGCRVSQASRRHFQINVRLTLRQESMSSILNDWSWESLYFLADVADEGLFRPAKPKGN